MYKITRQVVAQIVSVYRYCCYIRFCLSLKKRDKISHRPEIPVFLGTEKTKIKMIYFNR